MGYSGKPKGSSNQGGCSSGTKGTKAPSVRAVGERADKFHTSGGK